MTRRERHRQSNMQLKDVASGMSLEQAAKSESMQRLNEELNTNQIELEKQNDELRRAHQELLVMRDRFSELYDFAPVGYLSVNSQGVITEANLCFSTMLGLKRKDIINTSLREFVHKDSQTDYYLAIAEIVKSKDRKTVEVKFQKYCDGSGSEEAGFWGRLESKPMLDTDGKIYEIHLSISDITEHRKDQELLQHQAFYDKLTELPNRLLFINRFKQHLLHVNRSSNHGAILYIDIDNFKYLNDSFGHAVGDDVLRHVGKVLKLSIRADDSAARFGGDEFLVLLTNLNENNDLAAIEAESVANKIHSALLESWDFQGHELQTEASVGIALFPNGAVSVDDIISHADIAMYRAKNNGKNAVELYREGQDNLFKSRLDLYQDLRKAFNNDEFSLVYQPQLSQYREIVGAECLLRWQHPIKGAVSPAEFIPILEDGSLIVEVGTWVITQACKQLVEWKGMPAPFPQFTLAVNVSPRQFSQNDFVDCVKAILKETGANPHRLVLEITENMLLDDVEKIIVRMNRLKAIGIAFSIDDFGTGYSSLSYIKRLPLDTLKIDQSFVRNIHEDTDNSMLVSTMMAIADHLKLKVVAEGVETEDEQVVLLEKQCLYFQGYLFSRPLAKEKFHAYVRDLYLR